MYKGTEEIPLLNDIVAIFVLSIFVILLCHRIKLPTIVGFLITGVLVGPHGLGVVSRVEDVSNLASIGIVLLLFSVGMEFSFKKIFEYRKFFLVGGAVQVFVTLFTGYAIGYYLGRPTGEAIFLGCLLSLSSTAIVLRVLDQKGESHSPHARVIVGILIFQDIIAVIMMLGIPLLGDGDVSLDSEFLWLLAKGIGILCVVVAAALKLVPTLLYAIAKTRSRELFLLTVLAICFSTAWLAAIVGLSLSLGAFLAGLIVSDSEYRNVAIGDILPFQDIFTSFFFVSIGMLLNLSFFLDHPFTIILMAIGVIILKGSIAGFATLILGMPIRTAVIVGLALAQIGEFSFVLAKSGSEFGITSENNYQLFLAISLLTMAVTPSLISWAPNLAKRISDLPILSRFHYAPLDEQGAHHQLNNHIIIIGYGLTGRNLARSAKQAGIPYIILEMNPETVRSEKLKGEPIHFGDATHHSVLHHLNVETAKCVAVVINDSIAAHRITELARKMNPSANIIVRTRYLKEMKTLFALGADEVIPDEFGSSVEVFTRVLRNFQVPDEKMLQISSEIRAEGYEMLRLLYKQSSTLGDVKLSLTEVGVETYTIAGESLLPGKTIQQSGLRKDFGVTVLMIKRDSQVLTELGPEMEFCLGDVVVLVGNQSNLARASKLFKQESAQGKGELTLSNRSLSPEQT